MNPENSSPLSSQRVASIPELLLHIIGYVGASTLPDLCLVSTSFYQIIKANELQLTRSFFRQLYQGCGCDDLEPSNWPGKTVRDIQRVVHRHTTSEELAARLFEVHVPIDGFKFPAATIDPWGDSARRRIQQGLCVFYSCGDIATEMYSANFADLGISPPRPPSTLRRLRQQILKTVFRKTIRKYGPSESAQLEELICQRHEDYRRTLTPERQVSFYIARRLVYEELLVAPRSQFLDHLDPQFPAFCIHAPCFMARQTTRWFSLFLYDWDGRYEKCGPGVPEALEELYAYRKVPGRIKHLEECRRRNLYSVDDTARQWLIMFYRRYVTNTSALYDACWPIPLPTVVCM